MGKPILSKETHTGCRSESVSNFKYVWNYIFILVVCIRQFATVLDHQTRMFNTLDHSHWRLACWTHQVQRAFFSCRQLWYFTLFFTDYRSFVRVERGGVIWEAALVIPRHLVLSYEALCIASADFPVQHVILSSHLVFGPPLLRPPSTVPCIIVAASPSERLAWLYQAIFRRLKYSTR